MSIDGEAVEAEVGQTLVVAAAAHGVYIPTICSLPDQPSIGTCRVCSVRVNGQVMAACTIRVRDGLVVEVNAPDLADMRRAVVELLFVEGNHNCPSCEKSGRCQLQAVAYEVGMTSARFPYRYPVREADDSSQRIWLERDRCIFCQRCVELIHDRDTGRKVFSISHRGPAARIEIDTELADAMTDEQVKEAVAICPVGSILEKRVGHDTPIGERRFEVRSVRSRALGGGQP
ncbi:MAG TPA: 2Fe-2S iron-sulfur cluster-binding protein [Candidatus Lustribacter sp.]|nr:2Fe-2S iron-sulfur cluster-binding protein [Candidatus Lustribacter sp.]